MTQDLPRLGFRSSRWWRWVAAGALVAVLALAGCGSNTSPRTPGPGATTPAGNGY